MQRELNDVFNPGPTPQAQSTAGVLMDAARKRRLCIIRHFDGRARVVEPYRVFQARSGRRLLNCHQLAGHTRGTGRNGWKNLYLEDLYSACPLDVPFEDRTLEKRRLREAAAQADADTEEEYPLLAAAA